MTARSTSTLPTSRKISERSSILSSSSRRTRRHHHAENTSMSSLTLRQEQTALRSDSIRLILVCRSRTSMPFHTVARLALLRNSQLPSDASEATYFDVAGNSTADSTPIGSTNRARCPAEVASRKARMHVTGPAKLIPAADRRHDRVKTADVVRALTRCICWHHVREAISPRQSAIRPLAVASRCRQQE